ncbi:hypothetical protein AZI87_06250 [Bdellovibrio bacteriovorus]|uniref:Secreted protein n=1 Tax=Bdellovibrio bacteriovorus TaxID=959 RepID=A0A162GS50_BDEBC|nr:hypothetical protein [Bdellovibrio bacteriovorus]KYG68827.1 hypothetical protein AZI87_06250 [Bdellovibrio bacteriovorus]
MLKVIASILLFSSMASAEFVGFSHGNELSATAISGTVKVICSGFNGSGSAIYTCRDMALNPAAYDHFVGPQDSRTDRVELVATHADGSSRSKTAEYDGYRGKSKEAFNLWISTIFQKPLLEAGVNTIRYRIYSRNIEPMAEGTFVANVKRGAPRQCPTAQYTSSDINDCNSQYSICQRYFEEYNNCQ